MKYWLTQLYGCKQNIKQLLTYPTLISNSSWSFWGWRLAYSGFAIDEAYSRLIESFSRRILIIPAICMFDKHLSSFMNARAITRVINVLNTKFNQENMSPLDSARLLIWVILLLIVIVQLSQCI